MSPGGYLREALAYTLQNEGHFTDDPVDSGGPTKFGITQKTLSMWLARQATAEDVKNLDSDTAAKIYAAWYWQPLSLAQVTQSQIAIVLFDTAVLFGLGVSGLYAQKALIDCGYFGLSLDGSIGVRTLEALNAVRPAVFIKAFRQLLVTRIASMVESNPKDLKFKTGWENRVNRYLNIA